ncbi:MAG: hypothetical protein WEA04_01915 [Candidatus Andersenbacteria bacterium]
MNNRLRRSLTRIKKSLVLGVIVWLSVVTPAVTFAQSVDATEETASATECTGAGCGQGSDQGVDQGSGQGGLSAEDLGADETGELPEGVIDTRQGASQGSTNGVTAANTNTGTNSTNTAGVTATNSTTTGIANTALDTTNAAATGTTGGNTSSNNTGGTGIITGSAGIGVTQVKNDNTATVNGTAGLQVEGHNGNYVGDLNLGFGAGTANLSGGSSIRAVNEATGAGSTNNVGIATRTEELNEVQNDGRIDNILDLAAITGQNVANKNTGDAVITTGDANVAATLVNLLNTTVINGDLWITVADIFGNLEGNINLPDFSSWVAAHLLGIEVANENTGTNSTNAIAVDVSDRATTTIDNDADITTTVNAEAVTGQNETMANTGGAEVTTGDAQVSAGAISIANTTVEGGNWGLVIVNALNRWLGFLVGDSGEVRALSQDETLHEIAARNTNTGADSDNTIGVEVERERTTTVANDAVINNEINAQAITGQNEANKNTGGAQIATGDANVQATTVNIANTTVKDGSLFIAVVNIFGDWLGDLFYGGSALGTTATGPASVVVAEARSSETGADSANTIDINYDRHQETTIDNEADLATTLNATIDTGSNRASRNTGGALIDTGDGALALHARSAANLTGIAGAAGVGIAIQGLNETTGANSQNRIRAHINDEHIMTINNDANVSTVIGDRQVPAMVNTGNNVANQNTLGAMIMTGDIAAEVAIHNLVNQVLVALTGQGIVVDADFANRLTGALSTNSNELTVEQQALLAVLNRGLVDNIINLLLNTGGNTANENTGGGAISTGDICVEGVVKNVVNDVSATGVGGASLDLDQEAHLHTAAQLGATTGNNEAHRNTGKQQVTDAEGICPKLAVVVTPSPSPSPTPAPEEGQGGGEEAGAEAHDEEEAPAAAGGAAEAEPRVAAAVEMPPVAERILRRFPVAGGEQAAMILQGKKRLPWPFFVAMSLLLVGTAWRFDIRARAAQR